MKPVRTIAALLGSVALTATLLPTTLGISHAQAPRAPRLGDYYLALGDSLTVGFQPGAAISWTNGWTYQLRDMMAKTQPVELVNLGHRGECSDTFVRGGKAADCPTKTVDSPSQLAEALGFLNDHPGQIRLITVEIGGNDLNGNKQLFLGGTETQQRAILAKIFPQAAHNWGITFAALRQACHTCDIVALNQYNPIPHDMTPAKLAPVFATYTGLLRQAAAPAHVTVADVYTPFVGNEFRYTWFAKGDIHANTQGYAVMAGVVAKAAGKAAGMTQ